jgi:hypothetical protein
MRLYSKLVVTAMVTTALFASLAAVASGRNFAASTRNIRVAFEPLSIISSINATTRCRVTLEGSFHCSTIAKVPGALIGYITRATSDLPNCRSSSFSIKGSVRQETLPWHVRYVSFFGMLPRVQVAIALEEVGIRLLEVPITGNCEYQETIRAIISGPAGIPGNISEGPATILTEPGITIASETAMCPTARFESAFTPITVLGTTTNITLRLI